MTATGTGSSASPTPPADGHPTAPPASRGSSPTPASPRRPSSGTRATTRHASPSSTSAPAPSATTPATPSSATASSTGKRTAAPATPTRSSPRSARTTPPAEAHSAPSQPDTASRRATSSASPPASPASARARSKGKRARERRSYTDEERRVALELVEAAGIAAAHGSTGIPKATLSRWAKAAGIELDEHARARTRAAGAAVEAKAAELKVTTVDRLERILDDQLATLEAIGKLERRAAEAALNPADGAHLLRVERSSIGRTVELDDDTAAGALALSRLVSESITKRDVVGAATRAVHDLQLLKGDATERGAIVVRFGIPRPNALEADAQAVDEADLGGTT